MTPEQRRLVQESFKKLAPISEVAAAMFYERLFALDPALRALFRGDMAEQGRKLMAMIAMAVAALDRLETIVPAVRELGRRHAGYGVKAADYDTVGRALIGTLEAGLGADFTPPLREAWTACYGLLAGEMKQAAAIA